MATVSGSNLDIHENLVLYTTSEKYIIEPLDGDELFIIDRVSKEISLQSNQGQIPPSATSKPIYGIMGVIHLLSGPYLIVITKKSKIGEISGKPSNHSIWKVEVTELFPYARTLLHLTESQNQYNKIYLSMIQSVLQTNDFYFSTTYDISYNLQRLHNTSPDFLQMSLFERADQRFIWNAHIMRDLLAQQELRRYCLPVIHGFITIKQCSINQKQFTWALISRRSCLRAGTRFFLRGLDSEGQAANYIETEQIVEYDGCKSSFVQTRGSIPLFWSQLPDLTRKPTPVLSNQNHIDGFQRHFDTQIINYGRQVIVNLVDHKGAEALLERTLADVIQKANNPNIKYEAFDFHHECRHMRWDKLSILMERIAADQRDMAYFMVMQGDIISSLQDGVFRTNCVDSLDRTNVVQSLLARRSLQHQLQQLGVLVEGQRVENNLHFEKIYKTAWADNADICSIQYAGTGALKTDFTRTGKRTKKGLLFDGWNTLIRYYKNNFSDGFRQDSIDLFLGNYQVEENEGVTKTCPLAGKKGLKVLALPVILLLATAMCFLSLLIPAVHTTETIMFVLFWAGMVVATLLVILYYGTEFVDYPKLNEMRPKVKYE